MSDPKLPGLAEPLRSRVAVLLDRADGRIQIRSGRRSTAEQASLRIRNGCPDVHTSPASSCRIPTAIPGRSMHERGLAVDLMGDLQLADRLKGTVGLRRTVPSEFWHYEVDPAVAPAGLPAAGVGAGSGENTPPAAPEAASGDQGAAGGIAGSLDRLTDTGTWVRILSVIGGALLVVLGLVIISRDAWLPAAKAYAGSRTPAVV